MRIMLLSTIDLKNNDRKSKTVTLLRTESEFVLNAYGVYNPKIVDKFNLKLCVNESSAFNKYTFLFSDLVNKTSQIVPHHRATGMYFFEHRAGYSRGFFAGYSENEFTFLTKGIESTFEGRK